MIGKARSGATLIGRSGGRSATFVLHISRGLPFTSALHDPHLAALQFQRTARSFACVRWISSTASRTTMPSRASASYGSKPPPVSSPRQSSKRARAAGAHRSALLLSVRDSTSSAPARPRSTSGRSLAPIIASPSLRDDEVVDRPSPSRRLGEVEPAVRAAALVAHERGARDRLGADEQVPDVRAECQPGLNRRSASRARRLRARALRAPRSRRRRR